MNIEELLYYSQDQKVKIAVFNKSLTLLNSIFGLVKSSGKKGESNINSICPAVRYQPDYNSAGDLFVSKYMQDTRNAHIHTFTFTTKEEIAMLHTSSSKPTFISHAS